MERGKEGCERIQRMQLFVLDIESANCFSWFTLIWLSCPEGV